MQSSSWPTMGSWPTMLTLTDATAFTIETPCPPFRAFARATNGSADLQGPHDGSVSVLEARASLQNRGVLPSKQAQTPATHATFSCLALAAVSNATCHSDLHEASRPTVYTESRAVDTPLREGDNLSWATIKLPCKDCTKANPLKHAVVIAGARWCAQHSDSQELHSWIKDRRLNDQTLTSHPRRALVDASW